MKKHFFDFNCILIFLALVCAIFLPNKINFSQAEQSAGNFSNLVVFLRFDGEDEFVNDICATNTSVKQVVQNSYSLAEYSVHDYYLKVSNGKVNMQNIYLFNQDGGSFVLSKSRGYYCKQSTSNPIGYSQSEYYTRMSELVSDWSSAIMTAFENGCVLSNFDGSKTYTYGELDKNNDGRIDSLTIFYGYSNIYSVNTGDCLWNYQAYSTSVNLQYNNTTITSFAYTQITANFNYLYTDKNGVKFASLKTMIHETGHIFGLKDLYKTETLSPVYFMSAMSNALSPIPQYISAKEREVLGWLNSKNIYTINKAGTYTIDVTSSEMPNNIVCYKLTIPSLGDKILYLEYRKFDGTENKYDSQSKTVYNQEGKLISGNNIKSGLVCFLIKKDIEFPNNLASSIYDWDYQVLGGQYATKSDSALTSNESLSITSNLSIKVDNVQNGNLTFTITGTDIKENQSHTHNLQKVNYKAPTCQNTGNIEYSYCSTCNKYFNSDNIEIAYKDTILEKISHTPQKINGKAPTCSETGLTDGAKCSVCGTTLTPQTTIGKTPHTYSDWIIDKNPTTEEIGHKHKECLVCHEILTSENIPKLDMPTQSPDTNQSLSQNSISLIIILGGILLLGVVACVIFEIKAKRRF